MVRFQILKFISGLYLIVWRSHGKESITADESNNNNRSSPNVHSSDGFRFLVKARTSKDLGNGFVHLRAVSAETFSVVDSIVSLRKKRISKIRKKMNLVHLSRFYMSLTYTHGQALYSCYETIMFGRVTYETLGLPHSHSVKS